MAGDVFHEYKVLLVGYTGAYHTYIPTEQHFHEGSYEALGIIKYTNLAGPLQQSGLDQRLKTKLESIEGALHDS
jgi:hypothetical protein